MSEPGERQTPSPWPARIAGIAAALSLLLGIGGQQLIALVRLPAAGIVFEPGDPDRLEWLEQRREHWAIEDAWVEPELELDAASADEASDTAQRSVAPDEPRLDEGQ